MLEFKNVSVAYANGVEALSDVSLSVRDGEFCFVVGESGSGKSTIAKLLTGELRANVGTLMVNGYDMQKVKSRRLAEERRTVGKVYQDFRLISSMTVAENLEFAMQCVNATEAAIRKRIPEVLELVSLSGMEERLPAELSGGEQQRVAIARAIINRPELIVADEPTGNLDPDLAIEIMRLFVRINDMGTTTLVITHAKELVEMFPKRVIALQKGKIISDTGAVENKEVQA